MKNEECRIRIMFSCLRFPNCVSAIFHFSLFTFHSSLIIHFFIHVDYFNEKAKAYALMRFTMARRPLERVGER